MEHKKYVSYTVEVLYIIISGVGLNPFSTVFLYLWAQDLSSYTPAQN